MNNEIVESPRRNRIPGTGRVLRWILVPILVLTLPGLVLLTVIGWVGESIQSASKAFEFTAIMIAIWAAWLLGAMWVVRGTRR